MIVNTFHHNVKAQILIAIHAGCEELHVHGNLRLFQVLLSDMIMLALHDDIETKILVAVHALGEEFASGFLGNSYIILCNVVVFSLHDNVETKVLISIHARGEKLTTWLDDLLLELLLDNVIVLALHDNIHTEVLVTVHTLGEEGLRRLNTLELCSNVSLNLFIFLGTVIELIILVLKVGILVLHSLQLLLINC